ncbi:MAG TPA: ABC transporter permease, partial [Candidatus Baltobacteraceae bacterium]|nr:ABC transporter permease [Candidatus Baltobacteraceae bacterium]
RSWPTASGTFFTQSDVNAAAKVAVLGQTDVTQLFGTANPIGQTVIIKGVPFTVIGTLSPLGQSSLGTDQDDTILIPYTSAMQRITGLTTVNQLMVSAATADDVTAVQTAVTATLEARHHILNGAPDDFQVRNLQSIAAAASSTGAVMEFLLAGVAAVSLIVGGIGIMNIMMVSVTERTREIGLRMSVGARGATILQQFLTESIVLATIGGLIGVVFGFVGTFIVAALAKWPTQIPIAWVLLSVLFSGLVGVFFGYYPAKKAAGLNPIEALRFE